MLKKEDILEYLTSYGLTQDRFEKQLEIEKKKLLPLHNPKAVLHARTEAVLRPLRNSLFGKEGLFKFNQKRPSDTSTLKAKLAEDPDALDTKKTDSDKSLDIKPSNSDQALSVKAVDSDTPAESKKTDADMPLP